MAVRSGSGGFIKESASPGGRPPGRLMRGVVQASPVIGDGCFNAPERSYAIRAEVALTAELLVAAIYSEREDLFDFDIATDDDLWESIAFALVQQGFQRIEDRALALREEHRSGTVAAPEWLSLCRRRIADLISPAWQTAPHRCPCGYAATDDDAFDEHLTLAEGRMPKHFAVTESGPIHRFWEREPRLPRAATLNSP